VDSEYLGDGITDSLIRSLAQLPNLKVKSRAAVFRYKGRDIDPQMVAQELGVRAVLTGRLAQRKDDLSLSVELVDAAESNQIWGEQYHRKLSDILQVQEEVTSRIVENLQLQLTGQQQRQLTLRATANADAYRLYLKGRYYADRLTKEGFDRSLESFNQAIAIDPNYALAHQGVAHAHFQTLDLLFAPREAALRATAAARRALAIDETVAEAHETLAAVFWQYEWDWAGAEREFKRAIELNPQAATVQMNYGLFLALMGRFAEGRRALTRARELDPHDPFSIVVTSFSHYLARRSDDALKEALEAVRVDPDFWLAHSLLARVYAVKNRFPDAIGEMQKARRLDDGNGEILMDLGRVHGLAEQKAEARRVLTELQQLSTRRYVAPFHFAMVYTGLGDRDEAFAWLEKAYDARSWYLTWLKTAPEVDSLRSDPRFADLVRRIGLPR
jgi:TolB-like protein/Flp pilus assembly protein TadD